MLAPSIGLMLPGPAGLVPARGVMHGLPPMPLQPMRHPPVHITAFPNTDAPPQGVFMAVDLGTDTLLSLKKAISRQLGMVFPEPVDWDKDVNLYHFPPLPLPPVAQWPIVINILQDPQQLRHQDNLVLAFREALRQGPLSLLPQMPPPPMAMPMAMHEGLSDDEHQLYRKKKRKVDANGKLVKLKDMGKKRKLAPRCSTIAACVDQVRKFRSHCALTGQSLTNLNSTYVIHSRFERAEALQPGFAKWCDEQKLGSADAHEEAKKIIASKDPKSRIRLQPSGGSGKTVRKGSSQRVTPYPLKDKDDSQGLQLSATQTPAMLNHPDPHQLASSSAGSPPFVNVNVSLPPGHLVTDNGTIPPVHPVLWQEKNLCDLRASGHLGSELTLHALKKVLLALRAPLPKGHKVEFVLRLEQYLDHCPCRRGKGPPPSHPFSFAADLPGQAPYGPVYSRGLNSVVGPGAGAGAGTGRLGPGLNGGMGHHIPQHMGVPHPGHMNMHGAGAGAGPGPAGFMAGPMSRTIAHHPQTLSVMSSSGSGSGAGPCGHEDEEEEEVDDDDGQEDDLRVGGVSVPVPSFHSLPLHLRQHQRPLHHQHQQHQHQHQFSPPLRSSMQPLSMPVQMQMQMQQSMSMQHMQMQSMSVMQGQGMQAMPRMQQSVTMRMHPQGQGQGPMHGHAHGQTHNQSPPPQHRQTIGSAGAGAGSGQVGQQQAQQMRQHDGLSAMRAYPHHPHQQQQQQQLPQGQPLQRQYPHLMSAMTNMPQLPQQASHGRGIDSLPLSMTLPHDTEAGDGMEEQAELVSDHDLLSARARSITGLTGLQRLDDPIMPLSMQAHAFHPLQSHAQSPGQPPYPLVHTHGHTHQEALIQHQHQQQTRMPVTDMLAHPLSSSDVQTHRLGLPLGLGELEVLPGPVPVPEQLQDPE